MGVQIHNLVKDYQQVITMKNLYGKKLTIDAFNWIYQFLSTIRSGDGQPLKNYNHEVTSHLSGIFYRTIKLIEENIKPIYVFDGKPNALKYQEIQKRKEIRKIAENNYHDIEETDNKTEIKKYAQSTSKLNTTMINSAKELLTALGVPIVNAIEDGEAQASYMIQKGDAWACATQDYDSFLFGADRIIRNLSVGKTKKSHNKTIQNEIEFYSLQKTLEKLNITQEQFVTIGILVGVDFFEGIKGIGEKNAYKYVQQYDTLQNIIDNTKDKYNYSQLTPSFIEMVQNIFLHPKKNDDYQLQWHKINKEKVIEIMVEKNNFNKERIEKSLEPLCTHNSKQSNLSFLLK
ncbi:MAG: flap endonuclease-1 [Acidithiobacillus sp.]|jgi:flap endonuclease-1|uniref:flap endonuclease-1 n=1 Tax=Acidithiobacillus sp. TaxID=1872118 RepID=UPI00355F43D2